MNQLIALPAFRIPHAADTDHLPVLFYGTHLAAPVALRRAHFAVIVLPPDAHWHRCLRNLRRCYRSFSTINTHVCDCESYFARDCFDIRCYCCSYSSYCYEYLWRRISLWLLDLISCIYFSILHTNFSLTTFFVALLFASLSDSVSMLYVFDLTIAGYYPPVRVSLVIRDCRVKCKKLGACAMGNALIPSVLVLRIRRQWNLSKINNQQLLITTKNFRNALLLQRSWGCDVRLLSRLCNGNSLNFCKTNRISVLEYWKHYSY